MAKRKISADLGGSSFLETFQQPLPIDVGVSLSGRENDYTVCMKNKQGTIVAPSNLNILPHEMATARALADVGMDVEFVSRTQGNRAKSADFIADGVLWEVKSPTSAEAPARRTAPVSGRHLRLSAHERRSRGGGAQGGEEVGRILGLCKKAVVCGPLRRGSQD